MLQVFKNGQGSVVLRVKLRDSTSTSGAGLTGLTSASSGLIISTIADNEASATAYTVAGSKVETITTLGTYAAPTATKVRFKEVDSTNHPGVYELQIADARFAVSGAKSLLVSVLGATNLAQCDFVVPLWTVDPYVSGGNLPVKLADVAHGGSSANLTLGTVTTGALTLGDILGGNAVFTLFGPVDVTKLNGDANALDRLLRSCDGVALGTVGTGSTTTSIVTSSLVPAAVVTDQFKGKIVTFDLNTTTTALRGQSTDVTGSSSGGVLTVTQLTTAPVSTDTFVIG